MGMYCLLLSGWPKSANGGAADRGNWKSGGKTFGQQWDIDDGLQKKILFKTSDRYAKVTSS